MPAVANAETLSLDDVLARAASDHPEMRSAEADVAVAKAKRSQTRAAFGPTLTANASIQFWNDSIDMNLAEAAPQLPEPTTDYERIIAGLFNSEPISIRDQLTWDASLTLVQPLTPLWDVHLGSQITELGESVATTEMNATTRRLQKDAAVAYLRLNQARKALVIAEGSVKELEAQAQRLSDLVELGAAQNADKLRIDVALAAAKKTAFEAESNVELSRAALAVVLGKADIPDLDVTTIEPGELYAPATTLEALVAEANAKREEVSNLDKQIEQANLNADLKRADYYPDVVAMAQAKHAEGQSVAGQNTAFVGASLEWEIFAWGKTSSAVDEAEASAIKARVMREHLTNQIGLQVRKGWFDYEASRKGYEVASAALVQAEEAFRVETERYEAGRSTTTDLLSAQTAVNEARNNRDAAYYQALVHRTELVWALGRPMTKANLIEGGLQ